ncbi:MAG: DNA cytosine methyltransferase [Proteobacteria bacterium]|nr:DNA cytosine methyltransferase [Pseudomonadota bacterium]
MKPKVVDHSMDSHHTFEHAIQSPILVDPQWLKRTSWPAPTHSIEQSISIVDLFSGCGGLTLGAFEAARLLGKSIDIRLAVESELSPIEVYRQNFNLDSEIATQAEIQTVFDGELGAKPTNSELQIKEKIGDLDLILAGPPCQGHSDLNNKSRRNDSRNSLYLYVSRRLIPLTQVALDVVFARPACPGVGTHTDGQGALTVCIPEGVS